MKLKVKIGDVEKEVNIEIFEHNRIEFLEGYAEFKKKFEKEGDTLELTKEYIKFKRDMLIKCTNLTDEELKKMNLEDQNKIRKYLGNTMFPESGDEKIFF